MSDSLSVYLSWPPSVNHYWRTVKGRPILSAEGRRYRATLAGDIHQAKPGFRGPITGRLRVNLFTCQPDNRKRDLDNILKAVLDGLQHAGVYEDDSQIDVLNVVRGDTDKDNPRILVDIETIEGPACPGRSA